METKSLIALILLILGGTSLAISSLRHWKRTGKYIVTLWNFTKEHDRFEKNLFIAGLVFIFATFFIL